MVAYPTMLQKAKEPNSTIQQYREGNSLNIILRRNREMEELVSLLAALHSVAINSETPQLGRKKGWEVLS